MTVYMAAADDVFGGVSLGMTNFVLSFPTECLWWILGLNCVIS